MAIVSKREEDQQGLAQFHPAVAAWFTGTYPTVSNIQRLGWPMLQRGSHCLMTAPTGSGKTLAAFLHGIDRLVRMRSAGELGDETRILYISPLRALSNDINANLLAPLAGIDTQLRHLNADPARINTWVRTGDTTATERARMRRTHPHILATTPESMYILLTSKSGRLMLSTVDTLIVDEIHSLAGTKRGAHLSLSMERLHQLTNGQLQRIGLSATQKPLKAFANFLCGGRDCQILDASQQRHLDLQIQMPPTPLSAVMPNEVWGEIYDAISTITETHRVTLVFVQNRRQAERCARQIGERIGADQVCSHHGSLAREQRLEAERRLKQGELKCLVATASLELGIDIGDIDMVCQIGSPGNIGTMLQRIGRSRHQLGAIPSGRLFPTSPDDLVECTALLRALREGELEEIHCYPAPLDVLAQQLVAEVSCGEQQAESLLQLFRHAWPYRTLTTETYTEVVDMLSRGFTRQRRDALIHYDRVQGGLRPHPSARLTAITCGGTIPDQFEYEVVLMPQELRIGSLNEDFAFESMTGDIFQLGNHSYRILQVQQGKVLVEDAHGLPPNLPFWLGEFPGRSDQLSRAVSKLREHLDDWLTTLSPDKVLQRLELEYQLQGTASRQLLNYLQRARTILGQLPTQQCIVLERFLDAVGDMHLVLHSPYGARINRAWGLALRKRFCRKFNFELQAAALEDSILLSLSATHSFPLPEVAEYLQSQSATDVLTQAVLDAPVFTTRWRWNACISLAVKRFRNGRRSPPQFQRSDAENLVAQVFPDQIACAENLAGAREIPHHPLIDQTIYDCLQESMDAKGFTSILRAREDGRISFSSCDLLVPSPLAERIINARPYAFLDDAPAEERRALAISSAPGHGTAASMRQPSPKAVATVCDQLWPHTRTADQLYDWIDSIGFVSATEAVRQNWQAQIVALRAHDRIQPLKAGEPLWVSDRRYAKIVALLSANPPDPAQLTTLLRDRLEVSGPVSTAALTLLTGLSSEQIATALGTLEQEGTVIRTHIRGNNNELWCERHILARINRTSINLLRNAVRPVSPERFKSFLIDWQGVGSARRSGLNALDAVLRQMEGFSAPAECWEQALMPARLDDYGPNMLDALCASGRYLWLRLDMRTEPTRSASLQRTPIALIPREHLSLWLGTRPDAQPSARTQRILKLLQNLGPSFYADLVRESDMLPVQVEEALGELANLSLVSSDTFAGVRALLPITRHRHRRRRRRTALVPMDLAGRWFLLPEGSNDTDSLKHRAGVLLQRYGIVYRNLLERERHAPRWRDLLKYYWHMEAGGKIRGGRFIEGVDGEQFALPEALAELRRPDRPTDTIAGLAHADPLASILQTQTP